MSKEQIYFKNNLNIISNRYFSPIDWTLTSSTTLVQNGPGVRVMKGGLHIPQSFRTGTSPPDAV